MIDDECKITGIIDWSYSNTEPACSAFAGPYYLTDAGAFYDGHDQDGRDGLPTSEVALAGILEGKGEPELAKAIRNGIVQRRLAAIYNMEGGRWPSHERLFAQVRKDLDIDAGLGWPEWKELALERYRHDKGLRKLLGREQRGGLRRSTRIREMSAGKL